jgi:hypothetical protein
MCEVSESDLQKIRDWPTGDAQGWFEFIKSVWDENYGAIRERTVEIQLITGGWSENEAVISAMHDNLGLWLNTWELTRRGGLFEFRVSR